MNGKIKDIVTTSGRCLSEQDTPILRRLNNFLSLDLSGVSSPLKFEDPKANIVERYSRQHELGSVRYQNEVITPLDGQRPLFNFDPQTSESSQVENLHLKVGCQGSRFESPETKINMLPSEI